MKKITSFNFSLLNSLYLFLFLSFSFISFSQEEEPSLHKTQIGIHLNVDSPFKSVMPEMSTAGLFGFSVGHSPFLGSPLYFEFKAAWGGYSNEYSKDIFYAKNGWWYPAEADYNSGFQKYLLGSKFMAGKEFRMIRGFATPQIGLLRMRSKTTVTYWDGSGSIWNNDENDDGSQTASKTPVKNTGWVYGGEIGTEITLDKLFKIKGDQNVFKLVISGSFLRGFSEYTYADVDKMLNQTELGDQDPADFILMSHPNVDELQYIKTTSSKLQMWGINVGVNINF